MAEIADRQHGVVALRQLRGLGLGDDAVHKRAQNAGLHRIHRGVYAVGRKRLTDRGRWMAAVLAYGADTVLSHRSAASLWGVRLSASPKIEVTVPRGSARSRTGIRVHVSTTFAPVDVTTCEGIACTSVARTLVDLGDVVGERGVERACDRAEMLRLLDVNAVEEVLRRAGPRRGVGVLRSVLGEAGAEGIPASELEERFLLCCSEARLPQPAVNAWLSAGGAEIKADFLWRAERLIVETDGRAAHGTRQAFERDRLRDQRLSLAGYRVVRFTYRQVTREPDRVALTVGALLGR